MDAKITPQGVNIASDFTPVLQESARNAFFDYNFAEARKLLVRAQGLSPRTVRDRIIFADLTTQLHHREIEYLARGGDFDAAKTCLSSFLNWLRAASPKVFDEKHILHLRNSSRLMMELRRMPQLDASDLIDSIDAEIAVIDRFGRRPAPLSPLGMAVDGGDMRYGYLKQEGLKPTYGFLRDQQGTDTYLHRDNVSPHMWTHLNKGGRVRFSIGVGSQGRTFAKDVELDE